MSIPCPNFIREKFPLSTQAEEFIISSKTEIQNILTYKSSKFIVILGPCSIHDPKATLEYAVRLKVLSNNLKDSFFILMRVYYEKPRTSFGWKGYVTDPYLNQSSEIGDGLTLTRQLLTQIAELQIPIATEFLDPFTYPYFSDTISWGCIGARTSSSPLHRQIASNLPMPIGFKNTPEGSIDIAIQGMRVAKQAHRFLGLEKNGMVNLISSYGNHYSHLVLRGSNLASNYDPHSVNNALLELSRFDVMQRLIIDCSHDNSKRDIVKQQEVLASVIDQYIEGNNGICGLMAESFLYSGNQNITETLKYGVSVTDPCLDWETTERILYQAYHKLKLPEHVLVKT